MLKFMVVLYRKPDMDQAEFPVFLRVVHGPMVLAIPGLRRYVQNHVVRDPKRNHPGWDAVVELYFDDWDSMEAGWATPEGQKATADVGEFADLSPQHLVRRGRGENPNLRSEIKMACRTYEFCAETINADWLGRP
jgi:uncharacterized protein (TIGR02118 family)